MSLNDSKIKAVNVVRDKNGYFRHPDFPEFTEDNHTNYKKWVLEHNLEVAIVTIETSGDDIMNQYFDSDSSDCSFWEPIQPSTVGWFCLSIHSTVDGPVCFWAKELK